MSRIFKAAICLALLAACTTVQIIRPEQPDLKHSVSSIVEVSVNDTLFSTGSAVHIAPGVFLTAQHVVELPIYLAEAKRDITVQGLPVVRVERLGDRDAALLWVASGDLPLPRVWCVDPEPMQVGDPVWVSGYGLGSHWMTQGMATVDPDRLSVEVAPGDSGCPYMDAKGCVRGLIVARDRRAAHHTYTEPMCYLLPLIPQEVQDQMSCGCFETE